MIGRFGKLSTLFTILTIGLLAIGVGYGSWPTQLDISGTVTVEAICLEIMECETNDPPGHTFGPVPGADESLPDGFRRAPIRLGKDVAQSTCRIVDTNDDGFADTVLFEVDNAYPSYLGKVIATVFNCGSSPVRVTSFSIYYPNTDGRFDMVGIEGVPNQWTHPPEIQVRFAPADLPITISPGQMAFLGGFVHILQEAEMDSQYQFAIGIDVTGP